MGFIPLCCSHLPFLLLAVSCRSGPPPITIALDPGSFCPYWAHEGNSPSQTACLPRARIKTYCMLVRELWPEQEGRHVVWDGL